MGELCLHGAKFKVSEKDGILIIQWEGVQSFRPSNLYFIKLNASKASY